MTHLVVFAGSLLSRGVETHAQLVAWSAALRAVDVVVAGDADPKAWASVTNGLISGDDKKATKRLVNKAGHRVADTVLVSSPAAEGALHDSDSVKILLSFCRRLDVSCTVVVTVREQVDLLNAWYVQRILRMKTSKDFPSAVEKAIASGRHDLSHRLAPLLDAKEIELVVVPYSAAGGAGAAYAVLAAAGISGDRLDAFPPTDDTAGEDGPALEVGPVVVAATRLLHKRLTRLGLTDGPRSSVVAAGAAQLKDRARAGHWDDTSYWGWTPTLTADTTALFAAGNTAFAESMWGTGWPDPTPERTQTRLDFAGSDPHVVADVMTTIQHLVDELHPDRSPADSEGADASADAGQP